MKTRLTPASLLLALLVLQAPTVAQERPAVRVGDKVPDFALKDLGGKSRTLTELRKSAKSGVVALTFWCSFCHSCRHMEGNLDALARNTRAEAVVMALDASAGETPERVKSFAKEKGLTLPIVMDPEGKLADLFGVGVTTTTVIIDRDGILRYRGQFGHGQQGYAAEALKAVLAGKPVAQPETPLQG
jgi:peroxiredoxin